MNKLTKVAGNNFDIHNNMSYNMTYKNQWISGISYIRMTNYVEKKKTKKMVPLTRASKTMKPLQINLIKEVKDL